MSSLQSLFSDFPQAIAAGLVIAVVCSLLGVFVILKRVVFIGITLSEVAACGIALAMVLGVPPLVGAAALTLAAVGFLAYPYENNRIPRDALLGVVFVLTSGLSILLVSRSGFGLDEVKSLLYGDLILTTAADLRLVLIALVPVLAYLLAFLRPTLFTFVDREAARVLRLRVRLWEMLYFLALGVAVSAASKAAGALLVFCYLVVAPCAGALLSGRLWVVLLGSVLVAILSTLVGLYASFAADFPTNQTIAVVACGLCAVSLIARLMVRLVGAFLLKTNASDS